MYWQLTDPTDAGGQFQDRGKQYRPIIFVGDPQQQAIAEASKEQLQRAGHYAKPIITEIRPATTFWPAENYHQGFYQKILIGIAGFNVPANNCWSISGLSDSSVEPDN